MWDALGPWLLGGGMTGLVLGFARLSYRLHADAIASEARRADAAEKLAAFMTTAWQAERDRADLYQGHIGVLMGRGKDPT